jgi:homoserine O-acetyltransferase
MKILFVAVVWLLVVCACERAHSQSPAQAEGGAQQFATLGKLNVEKSNAVLWPTWLGGRTEDLLEFIGPGKVVDSSKYFVILVDAIGDGVSTSPSNSGARPRMKFPKFTIRDMVESEHRLATEVLRLTHLHAVMGLSMGGMQTFEWAVAYPDFMDVTIPMEGSPQSTSYDKLLWTSEIDAIEMDPAWNTGNPTEPLTRGIALEEEIDSMNVTSPAYRVTHTKTESFENFLGEMRKNSRSNAGAVSDQVRQREAIMALNIPREFGVTLEQAAKKIRSRMLVIVSLEDHMVNPSPAVEFASAIGAPVVSLDSLCGHLSLSCISVGPIVAQFLADPASVRSQTLKDPSSR